MERSLEIQQPLDPADLMGIFAGGISGNAEFTELPLATRRRISIMEVKVEIYRNRFVLSTQEKTVTVVSEKRFTTNRLLVGQFQEASRCLEEGMGKIGATSFLRMLKPSVTMIPKEMIEGGISQVEGRVFRELAMTVGAKSVELLADEIENDDV